MTIDDTTSPAQSVERQNDDPRFVGYVSTNATCKQSTLILKPSVELEADGSLTQDSAVLCSDNDDGATRAYTVQNMHAQCCHTLYSCPEITACVNGTVLAGAGKPVTWYVNYLIV